MDVFQIRNELRKMNRKYLLRLASTQRISKCVIGGQACGLYLSYKGFRFCVSEIMGEGCQVEKSAKLEGVSEGKKETNWSLPLLNRIGIDLLPPGKNAPEFKVYDRDEVTRLITFLGSVIERRTRERGNNLNDLLVKAIKDYSGCVASPSTIFLLSP